MRTSRLLALAVSTAVIGGSAGAVHAEPAGPQRLRGMDGRSFAVTVTGLGEPFANCYTFRAGGVWDDPLLPAPGSWQQTRVGASTSYSASLGPIEQHGTVTPAGGGGELRLHAVTGVPAGVLGPDPLTLVSVGHEVDTCP